MITEKQKCIAEQAIYGDLYFNDSTFLIQSISGTDIYLPVGTVADIDDVKPILRPMSDLTKEITHKGYNDDKPFVPLVECERLNAIPVDDTKRALKYFDLLSLWHFDFRYLIKKGEAIDVNSLPKNPYKI